MTTDMERWSPPRQLSRGGAVAGWRGGQQAGVGSGDGAIGAIVTPASGRHGPAIWTPDTRMDRLWRRAARARQPGRPAVAPLEGVGGRAASGVPPAPDGADNGRNGDAGVTDDGISQIGAEAHPIAIRLRGQSRVVIPAPVPYHRGGLVHEPLTGSQHVEEGSQVVAPSCRGARSEGGVESPEATEALGVEGHVGPGPALPRARGNRRSPGRCASRSKILGSKPLAKDPCRSRSTWALVRNSPG